MPMHDAIALVVGDRPVEPGPGLVAQRVEGVTVVYTNARAPRFLRARRKALSAELVIRQQRLEGLAPQGTVLAFLRGTTLEPQEIPALIHANHPALGTLAAPLQGQAQFQISIDWDPLAAGRHFGWAGPQQAEAGREAFAREVREALAPLLPQILDLPRREEMALNMAILIDQQDEARLDAIMAQIDAIWSEGLRIRLVGPSPAVSFASLGLRRVHKVETLAARAVLGLSAGADATAIKAARRSALLAVGPDGQAPLREAADICFAATRAGTDRFPLILPWSEGRAPPQTRSKEVA